MIEVLVQLYVSSYFSGNKDFDKAYEQAVPKVAVQEASVELGKNTRLAGLARRRLHGTDTAGD